MVKSAFVFPGQGSQSVGMLQDLANHYPVVLELFTEVSESLGYDVWHLVQHGPEARLNQTEHTQVAMLTADVAVYRVLQQEKK
ncbi:acyl-carrier-protein S-malonyltransferase [Legionella oakridgensis ATCC 33761 = DSM 21215]|nr:acyl-carrier-protein S-malonyltransferase [Legionella oakridgensis ATCC 33761 = DSM 21215]